MDPLTALGLASNIIQLISFTGDLVSKSREIYHSADGSLVENLELEVITVSLRELSSGLEIPHHGAKLSKTEKQLQELCDGCKSVSKQLLDAIQGLKSQGSNQRWNSFRQALKSAWKESEIEELYLRLERYRRQLDTTLLVSIREQLQRSSPGSKSSENMMQQLHSSMEESKHRHSELTEMLQRMSLQSKSEIDEATLSSQLLTISKHQTDELFQLRILEKLRFTDMEGRHEGIAEAHKRTFDWIFYDEQDYVAAMETHESAGFAQIHGHKPQWSSFTQWLQGEKPLYWVTGKAGSGKSTLMKYLYNHDGTRKNLRKWSGDSPMKLGGFFFWNSGTSMQMSKLGLLQTLLYQSIQNSPKQIPTLFPDRWKYHEVFGGDLRPWSMSELVRAFKILVADDSTKFVFFIDGLDEFDGKGSDLADFVLNVSKGRKNVKMCVASRPWLVFEDAFQTLPSLRLEDLTAPDISFFVSEILSANHMFVGLKKLEPENAESLVTEVVEKASGVFLWVRLVVASLLEGLRDGDRISNLKERLLLLPSDLEELFFKILNRLDLLYFKQASMYFQLVHAAAKPLTLTTLSFAEDGLDAALAAEVKPLHPQKISHIAENMRRRLNSRCKGLLEAPAFISEGAEAKVQYLHRTVKDFLARADIWAYIVSGTNGSFDVDATLCGAFILNIKSMECHPDMLNTFWSFVQGCINSSLRLERRAEATHISVIEELDKAASLLIRDSWLCYFSIKINRSLEHWTATKGMISESGLDEQYIRFNLSSFFNFAFHEALYTYVRYRVKTGYPIDSVIGPGPKFGECWPLFCRAVIVEDFELVELILQRGANPNVRPPLTRTIRWDKTPWQDFLIKYRGCIGDPDKITQIFLLLLSGGADPYLIVDGTSLETIIDKWLGLRLDQKQVLLAKLRESRKGQWKGEGLYRLKKFLNGNVK